MSCTCSPTRFASATGSVYLRSSLSTISGHMKSFHMLRNMNVAYVARIGLKSGIATVQKIRNSPAPSIRAASSSSSGTPRAYWRTMKIPKMGARPGIIAPSSVFTSPSLWSIRNSGSIPTWPGITSAASSTRNRRSRAPKRSLANPYPAMPTMTTDISVVPNATMTLLPRWRARSSRVNSAT